MMRSPRPRRFSRPVMAAAFAVVLFAIVMLGLRLVPQRYPVADGALLEIYTLHAAHGTLHLGAYSRYQWNHPGPAYFYLLAPGYILSGYREDSLLVTVLVLNLISIGGLIWLARKYGGAALAYGLTIWLALFYAHQNSAVGWDFGDLLSNPWNPHTPVLPFALLMGLSAAIASGHLVALPVAALVATVVGQTHVAFIPVSLTAVGVGLGLLVVRQARLAAGPVGPPAARLRPPMAVRLLDAVVIAYVVLFVWAVAFGGMDVSLAGLHVSARSPDKLGLYALALLVVRHLAWRHHPRLARVWTWARHVGGSTDVPRIAPREAIRLGTISAIVLAVVWGLPLIDEIAHWGSGNLVAMVRSVAGSPAMDIPRGLAAFTLYLPGVLRPGLEVAAGGRVITAAMLDRTDVVLSLAELVLLAAATLWAMRRRRTLHASLGLVALAVSAAAFWSMVRVRDDLYDHLAFWIGMVGVVNLGVITAVPLEWVGSWIAGRRSSAPPADRARRRDTIVLSACVVLFAVYGAAHIVAEHQQTRFPDDRAATEALWKSLWKDLQAHGMAGRPTLVDMRQDAWPLATGVVLQLYKTGTPIAVTDQWLFLFGHPLASTGREEVEIVFADGALHDQLRHDPAYRLVGHRERVYLYVKKLVPTVASARGDGAGRVGEAWPPRHQGRLLRSIRAIPRSRSLHGSTMTASGDSIVACGCSMSTGPSTSCHPAYS